MSKIKYVTRHVEFEMAHLLPGYPGACMNLHGHSYKLEVAIYSANTNNDNPYGFIIDFKELDAILKSVVPDHAFAYNKNTPAGSAEFEIAEVIKRQGLRYAEFDDVTSAENMIEEIVSAVESKLPIGLHVARADLWETTNSHATWVSPEFMNISTK